MTKVKKRIQGTPDFIAPEQVMKMPLDARTDVFNLGATMYWCLTGRAYPTRLKSKRTDATFNVNAAHEVQSPRDCNDAVPAVLSNLVMECCRNNPGNRPRDMSVVLDELKTASSLLRRKDDQAAKQRRPTDA